MIVTLPANGPLVLLGKKDKLQEVWFQVVGAKAEAEIHLDERGLVINHHSRKRRNMARKKAAPTAVNAAPTAVNAAPNYQPPAPGGGPAPTWTPPTAQAPANGAQTAFTPPPAQGERNPFINAQWLWQNGDQGSALRPIQGRITGVRQASGGRPEYANRGGFFLDVEWRGGKATARVNIGDQRHQRLYAKFGANLMGQTVTFRLSHPGDQTKALWTVE